MPRQISQSEEARRRYPDELQLLAPALNRSDPLADAAMGALACHPRRERHQILSGALTGRPCGLEPLDTMVAEARLLTRRVNGSQLRRALRPFRRAGFLGGLSLGLHSLVLGYASPLGNKPLALSGHLLRQADQRLNATAKFVSAVCSEGGMHADGVGFASALRVRLIHAEARDRALAHSAWEEDWGLPINQHDMLSTILLFSTVFLEGISKMGVTVSDQEADDYQEMWNLVGRVIGVETSLLPGSGQQAAKQAAFVRLTLGPPDRDARALVTALLSGPLRLAQNEQEKRRARGQVAFATGLCRGLIGAQLADELQLAKTPWRYALPLMHSTVSRLELLRGELSTVNTFVESMGEQYWRRLVELGVDGRGDGN